MSVTTVNRLRRGRGLEGYDGADVGQALILGVLARSAPGRIGPGRNHPAGPQSSAMSMGDQA